jgi:hypothetical protein
MRTVTTTETRRAAQAPAARVGVASALLNVSRQLGGALGMAVISTIVTLSTAHAMTFGHATTAGAMTAGFHAGFTVSATLLAATAAAALVLLREDGRGQSVNLVELQTAGALRPGQSDRRDSHEHVVRR